MKKIFQTIIDKDHGNCMQAAIASLLDLELNEVPNFIEFKNDFNNTTIGWLSKKGYSPTYIHKYRHDEEMLKRIALFDGGVNKYFYAIVPSQTYKDTSHAVVVDINLNVVHDPNPNQLALLLKPKDVEGILILKDIVIGKTGKLFTKEEWESTSEEERDANTYRVIYDENDKIIETK
jgi:hypothetical protein